MIDRRTLELVADMADRWHERHEGGQSCTDEMTLALASVRAELRQSHHRWAGL